MYTGQPHDRNTRQCRLLVNLLHGLHLTCTREDPTTITPASVAKQHNNPFLYLFAWEDPTIVTPASVANQQHNKTFVCIVLMGYT